MYVPNISMLWNNITGNPTVTEIMPLNKEKIWPYIHFNDKEKQVTDITSAEYDKFHKIRLILNDLGEKCLRYSHEKCLSIDEQIYATKARHHLKQYLLLKIDIWSLKLIVLCGISDLQIK